MTNTTLTVDDMVRREVSQCVSVLFDDLLKLTANADRDVLEDISFSDDNLRDLQCRPDYEEAGRDHINNMDRDQLLEALEAADVEDERSDEEKAAAIEPARLVALEQDRADYPHLVINLADIDDDDDRLRFPGVSDETLRQFLIAAIEADTDDAWQNFTNEHDLEPEDIEVYEHWIVSDWLARRLREKGEIVGEIANLTIWARTTTGQMISMDYVITEIHKDLTAPD